MASTMVVSRSIKNLGPNSCHGERSVSPDLLINSSANNIPIMRYAAKYVSENDCIAFLNVFFILVIENFVEGRLV